jgi:hypothetical protein
MTALAIGGITAEERGDPVILKRDGLSASFELVGEARAAADRRPTYHVRVRLDSRAPQNIAFKQATATIDTKSGVSSSDYSLHIAGASAGLQVEYNRGTVHRPLQVVPKNAGRAIAGQWNSFDDATSPGMKIGLPRKGWVILDLAWPAEFQPERLLIEEVLEADLKRVLIKPAAGDSAKPKTSKRKRSP